MKTTQGELIPVTVEMIDAGRNGVAGWNKKQLVILGLKWPLKTGWRQRLAASGKRITREQYEKFLALKGRTKTVERMEREATEAKQEHIPFDVAARPHSTQTNRCQMSVSYSKEMKQKAEDLNMKLVTIAAAGLEFQEPVTEAEEAEVIRFLLDFRERIRNRSCCKSEGGILAGVNALPSSL